MDNYNLRPASYLQIVKLTQEEYDNAYKQQNTFYFTIDTRQVFIGDQKYFSYATYEEFKDLLRIENYIQIETVFNKSLKDIINDLKENVIYQGTILLPFSDEDRDIISTEPSNGTFKLESFETQRFLYFFNDNIVYRSNKISDGVWTDWYAANESLLRPILKNNFISLIPNTITDNENNYTFSVSSNNEIKITGSVPTMSFPISFITVNPDITAQQVFSIQSNNTILEEMEFKISTNLQNELSFNQRDNVLYAELSAGEVIKTFTINFINSTILPDSSVLLQIQLENGTEPTSFKPPILEYKIKKEYLDSVANVDHIPYEEIEALN